MGYSALLTFYECPHLHVTPEEACALIPGAEVRPDVCREQPRFYREYCAAHEVGGPSDLIGRGAQPGQEAVEYDRSILPQKETKNKRGPDRGRD